jgi:ribosomal-protein-serine acetyltransferase
VTLRGRTPVLDLVLPGDVHLRLLEDDDADELYRVIDGDRDRLARWMPWARAQTLEGTRAFISATRRQVGEDDGMQTAVEAEGRIAGIVGVHGISWLHGSTTIGYWLAEEFTGRGLMTASVRAYTRHAFGTWGLHRMELRAAVDNDRSRAVAERAGFVPEGVLRGAERVGDRYHDLMVYSALATEWMATP